MFSILRKNKRGALELSMNAIVIIVVAFVTLAAILGIGRMIFGKTTDKLPDILDLGDLDSKPTADNPITLANKIVIPTGSSKEFKVGVYNSAVDDISNAVFLFESCVDSDPSEGETADVAAEKLPTIVSLKTDIASGSSKAFNVIVKLSSVAANKLATGLYACNFIVASDDDTTTALIEKQIFLQVAS